MKIKFALGPYGYEVVLGNITEQIYNKYAEDNQALVDDVSGFNEDSELKEWSDNDDINHVYGAVVEEEGTEQYLKILDDKETELLNIPLTKELIKKNGINLKEDINHSGEKDLIENFYFFGQSGEKGEWENYDDLIEVDQLNMKDFNVHIANLDGLKIAYAISYKDKPKIALNVVSSNPNFQNFEVRMGEDV
jgi:hypothetical protein|tara:strand:- start:2029 stop:2604 length:576 start_codon:yes stop_codon:yes gene_type:complete